MSTTHLHSIISSHLMSIFFFSTGSRQQHSACTDKQHRRQHHRPGGRRTGRYRSRRTSRWRRKRRLVDGCWGQGRRAGWMISWGDSRLSGDRGRKRTMRFTSPTCRPARVSRASSLWPTSSKASVASWPPTSRRTSSPPLGCVSLVSYIRDPSEDVRVLIDEAGAVVDLVVDDQVEVLLGVVASDLLEGEFFGGHFD